MKEGSPIHVFLHTRGHFVLDFKLLPCLNVVCFLLAASEFYMPTFRSTLSFPSS